MGIVRVHNATVGTDDDGDFHLKLNLGKFNGWSPNREEIRYMIKRCREYGGRPLLRVKLPKSRAEWEALAKWARNKTFRFDRLGGIK